jgi:hypothetical protein
MWRVLSRGIEQRQVLLHNTRVLENEATAATDVAIRPGYAVETVTHER